MRRMVSVWLPRWPIERLARAEPKARDELLAGPPLALIEAGVHGLTITAVNARAQKEGVHRGETLADARARLPALNTRPAEPARDRAALVGLARWCGRYGPSRHVDGTDGLWLDITGVAHLFGGEPALVANLLGRLARAGVTARAGLSDTLGAASALARYADQTIAAPGAAAAALAGLPVEGLRLAPATTHLLRRLGLKRIGQLAGIPRASLARRFPAKQDAAALLLRLDQAFGREAEPLVPLGRPPLHAVRRDFSEPLIAHEGLAGEVARLAGELCTALADAHLGARRVTLGLYRADGTSADLAIGLSSPTHAPAHLLRLLGERLAAADAGFGIDGLVLAATVVGPLPPAQRSLDAAAAERPAHAALAPLIDQLANRLGSSAVCRLAPAGSHLPERAALRVPIMTGPAARTGPAAWPAKAPRPPLLLPSPEAIGVIAGVPEGPPVRFSWRRVSRRVTRAEGPERIEAEWWRTPGAPPARPRDYYRLEDEDGRRYWVFREGLYQRESDDGPPVWFVHGLYG